MIIHQLLDTLYSNNSPYLNCEEKYVDNGYRHTNILCDLLEILFTNSEPNYIVECGSMLGGSAIKMAKTLKDNNKTTEIVCIDPFTGDVNMWDWEKNGENGNGGWRYLKLENGIPTIYKRFLANCKYNGFENKILPINATTNVGIKLLQRLFKQNRITELPNYIYLDSAHEKDETFIELSLCWDCLVKNGILFGDDWSWKAVREDVIKFSNTTKDNTDYENLNKINNLLTDSEIINGNILLYKGQWVLFKN
jgi:predicted O-methyltransferase YrrM